jgi:hypothetical protein
MVVKLISSYEYTAICWRKLLAANYISLFSGGRNNLLKHWMCGNITGCAKMISSWNLWYTVASKLDSNGLLLHPRNKPCHAPISLYYRHVY